MTTCMCGAWDCEECRGARASMTELTPETLDYIEQRIRQQTWDGDLVAACKAAWEADQMKAANIIVEQQTRIEALERESDGLVDAYNAKSQRCAELEVALAKKEKNNE